MLTVQDIASVIQIGLPLEEIKLTQSFGNEFWWWDNSKRKLVKFYARFGMKGHNGLDFRIHRNMATNIVCDGICTEASENKGYGITIRYETGEMMFGENIRFKLEFVHGHLKSLGVKEGDELKIGQFGGICDNTGYATTGDHLHFGVRVWYKVNGGGWLKLRNGYNGWIDPDKLFYDRGWKNEPVINRYYRTDVYDPTNPGWRPWHAYVNEKKVAMSLWKYLKKRPTNEQINACVYGGWPREMVKNDGMYPRYARIKYGEYRRGKLPGLRY